MPQKKSRKEPPPDESTEPFMTPLPFDPRSMQKGMSDLMRLLNQQEFQSEQELDDFMQQLITSGQPPTPPPPQTPLEEAQEVMFDAWEATSRAKRVKLAKKALTISPDCADAYVLLAEESPTLEEALPLYEQAVAAAERALGPEIFQEAVGHFWGIFETRPYMRAREGLASCLWGLDRKEEAAAHFQDMLRLNPGDNQGLRYSLLSLYLEMDDRAALDALLTQYKDDYSAQWFYTQALVAFRKHGAGRRSDNKLRKAIAYNRHVPIYLLGRKRVPAQSLPFVSFGDAGEAADYVQEHLIYWNGTPGALDWLRHITGQIDKPKLSLKRG